MSHLESPSHAAGCAWRLPILLVLGHRVQTRVDNPRALRRISYPVTSFLLFSQSFYPMDLYTRVLYDPANSANVLFFGESPLRALLLPYVFAPRMRGTP